MINGYLMRDILNKLDELNFGSTEELHTLSRFYESMLREMRDAAGSSGEFYTPRPIVELMVKLTNPTLGEVVLDPACGTGGFLVESVRHLKEQVQNTDDEDVLQQTSIRGGEAKSLPLLLCEMNLLLNGLDAPKIEFRNSLAQKLTEIGDAQRVDVILANPPFGGEEESSIKLNFPPNLQTSETALLFLQLIMRRLKRPIRGQNGGRAAVVVPNSTLYADGVSARVKHHLVSNFNLHTIIRLPNGVFAPYTEIPTNILFFEPKGKTDKIWFYEHPHPEGKKYTKSNPIAYSEFEELFEWWENKKESENAWIIQATDIIELDEKGTCVSLNLEIDNPRKSLQPELRSPSEIESSISSKISQLSEIFSRFSSGD